MCKKRGGAQGGEGSGLERRKWRALTRKPLHVTEPEIEYRLLKATSVSLAHLGWSLPRLTEIHLRFYSYTGGKQEFQMSEGTLLTTPTSWSRAAWQTVTR